MLTDHFLPLRPHQEIISHPDFSSISKMNDIALIRIKSVEFSRNILPACLHRDLRDMNSNIQLIVTGWGSVSAERELNNNNQLTTEHVKTENFVLILIFLFFDFQEQTNHQPCSKRN